jgi:DNA topoisomerase VI subunit B
MKKLDKNSAQEENSGRKKILTREVFETSRELEYFSEKELRAQIGHDPSFWPIAILRELIDNSLDACEKTNIAPTIEIDIKDDFITVSDNGTGIPIEIINKSLNYLSRVSDKAYYISPTRGQMGNALKVIYAAPFVTSGNGYVEIGSHGELHHISITVDRIAGKPKINHSITTFVKNGTFVKIHYPKSTSLLLIKNSNSYNIIPPTAQELIEGYIAFNPHATFILNGKKYNATDTNWTKWTPNMQISPHWYNVETLSDLVAGYLVKERGNGQHRKTVREFVSEFRGITGTAKQKKVTENYSRSYINEFEKDGDIDRESLKLLLDNMQKECIAPKPNLLGIIGKEHFTSWMIGKGGAEHSVRYSKKTGIDGGLPYVLEIGFAVKEDNTARRTMITGLNWSPVIGNESVPTLQKAVQEARLDPHDAVIFMVHIARPRFEFLDRGKTKIEFMSLSDDISSAVKSITKGWKAEKRKADKNDRISSSQYAKLRGYRTISIRDVAFDVMEAAYNLASSNGEYYANARQIMYAARPEILKRTGKDELNDVYFTQTLLKDYIEERDPDWKIVWDARGHIIEPHTNEKIGLGGIEVDNYINKWHSRIIIEPPDFQSLVKTNGPGNRFNNVLFIEKEGFTEILTHAGIPERYDLALMSTKGIPVKAACDLIHEMSNIDVRVFVLHDFDLSGFKILRSLTEGVRLSCGSDVIDLGLRMADIKDLIAEPVQYKQRIDPGLYLEFDCDATQEEIDFLVDPKGGYTSHHGQRVEINAMTSQQLIAWLEDKLQGYGVEKFIPDQDTLSMGFRRAKYLGLVEKKTKEMQESMVEDDEEIPDYLTELIERKFREDQSLSWDEALWDIVKNQH